MSSPLRALLIGVGDYSPNRLPDGEECPNLEGAVPDVESVESFLRERLGLAPERTLKLTVRPGGSPEPPERRPTHDNIVKAFQRLALEAEPGDPIYIHYSGHGARLQTQFPELKGRGGFDERLEARVRLAEFSRMNEDENGRPELSVERFGRKNRHDESSMRAVLDTLS